MCLCQLLCLFKNKIKCHCTYPNLYSTISSCLSFIKKSFYIYCVLKYHNEYKSLLFNNFFQMNTLPLSYEYNSSLP